MLILTYRQALLIAALATTVLFGWSAIVTPATTAASVQLDRAGQYLYEQTGLAELATSVGERTTDLEQTIDDSGVEDAELVTTVEEGVR